MIAFRMQFCSLDFSFQLDLKVRAEVSKYRGESVHMETTPEQLDFVNNLGAAMYLLFALIGNFISHVFQASSICSKYFCLSEHSNSKISSKKMWQYDSENG